MDGERDIRHLIDDEIDVEIVRLNISSKDQGVPTQVDSAYLQAMEEVTEAARAFVLAYDHLRLKLNNLKG